AGLGAHGVLVLGLAGDAAQLGDVLGGLAHGDVGVGQLAVLTRIVPGGGDLPGGALLGALPGLLEQRVAGVLLHELAGAHRDRLDAGGDDGAVLAGDDRV